MVAAYRWPQASKSEKEVENELSPRSNLGTGERSPRRSDGPPGKKESGHSENIHIQDLVTRLGLDWNTLNRLGIVFPTFPETTNPTARDGLAYDTLNGRLQSALPEVRPSTTKRWTLLGRQIGFPIGIPASVLTRNSASLLDCVQQGYNVLTYKTVRSRKVETYDWPNWVFLSDRVAQVARTHQAARLILTGDDSLKEMMDWEKILAARPRLSALNSYGVESPEPGDWKNDFRVALDGIDHEEQLLVLSILGDVYGDDLNLGPALYRERLIADWLDVAAHAAECSPHAIELNLSCPNHLDDKLGTDKPLAPLCNDPVLSIEIVRAVSEANPGTPLLVKLSALPFHTLEKLLIGCGDRLSGVSGINAIPRFSSSDDGNAPFFAARSWAGLSGWAIQPAADRLVKNLTMIRRTHRFSWDIVGMGGVNTSDDFKRMWDLGCNAVQSATGASGHPALAAECLLRFEGSLGAQHHSGGWLGAWLLRHRDAIGSASAFLATGGTSLLLKDLQGQAEIQGEITDLDKSA